MSVHTEHVDIDEIADAAAGALPNDRTRVVEQHVDLCSSCHQVWAALAEVSARLGSEPSPPMPPDVAKRLGDVVQAESRRRSRAEDDIPSSSSWLDAAPPTFGADLPLRTRRQTAGSILAACGVASVVGFAGYLLSATAGLNEPSVVTPAVISSSRLAAQAQALQPGADGDPHRFSRAWRCARQVIPGRITGLTPATVDGQEALLVYSVGVDVGMVGGEDDATLVTVVTGCASDMPTAGLSTTVPR